MKRQGCPAAPWTPTATFFSEKLPSPSAAAFLSFLGQCGCLTNSGERLLESHHLLETLTLRDEHVRGWARALVEQAWPAPGVQWSEIWQDYRQRYDFGKPVKPNRLQRWLVRYSRDATALGLLANLAHFPGLVEQLEPMASRATGPEAELLMDFVRAGHQPENLLAKAPERMLLLLPYLQLEPRRRLELSWLASGCAHPELSLVSRACNLSPVDLRAVESLPDEAREHLAEAAHRTLLCQGLEQLGASALRSVGDARSLSALAQRRTNSGQVRFGSRPGRDLLAAMCQQAELAIRARSAVHGRR
ncbi:MAG: hypothetical protein AB7S38_03130 [Vulcanimicrobiota bacterium]